jgi:hypothetical protein
MTPNTGSKNFGIENILGLRPLDRVEVISREALRTAADFGHMGRGNELPYWYFQHTLPDGRLEIRSPGGSEEVIGIEDVANVIPGKPIVVRVRHPQDKWNLLNANTRAESEAELAKPAIWHEALLMNITKDRWGRIDQVRVLYPNQEMRSHCASKLPAWVHDDDRHALRRITRSCAPIITPKGGASWSADAGRQSEANKRNTLARAFIAGRKTASDLAFI